MFSYLLGFISVFLGYSIGNRYDRGLLGVVIGEVLLEMLGYLLGFISVFLGYSIGNRYNRRVQGMVIGALLGIPVYLLTKYLISVQW